ncbi:MAG TPA: phosphoglycerate kinase [bacterium]|nr:phosphoglycerate kinase [bacterium]HPW39798.1 phosphoglycerate kinase [bacterium]
MNIKSIRQAKKLKGRRVLLRVDFNVPINKDGQVGKDEDYRLVQSLPTIRYLIKKKAKIIIMAHLGRPDGKRVERLRLDPVAVRLSQLLRKSIYKSDIIFGKEVEQKIEQMKPGEVLLLENIRFDRREEKGNKIFAKQLAKLGDVFVNDGFAVSHREHVSVATIQHYLPSYAGLLLEGELKSLSGIFERSPKPLVAIIGGAKISTKIKVISRFLKYADYVLLGGALANTVLKAMGVAVGKSLIEPKMIGEIRQIKLTDDQLRVPVDGIFAGSFQAIKGRIDALGDIRKNEVILDIGPETIELYRHIISQAKTVVWNGPMGLIETPFFARGTKELIKILAQSKAKTIVGGGETVQLIRMMGLEKKFTFISTGGGAMLEYLEGKKLPGLKKIVY